MSHHRIVARRNLIYSNKGADSFKDFAICISEPYLVTSEIGNGSSCEEDASCTISFDGLPEMDQVVTGVDTFQALELALSSAEKHLQRLRKKYDFYFEPGVPYFDS